MSLYLPLPVPLPPSTEAAPSPLAADQESKRLNVLAHFTTDGYELPNVTESATLTDKEKFWLVGASDGCSLGTRIETHAFGQSDECIQRYLRATKWDTPGAIKRLEETLKWRREYGLYDKLTAELVEPEVSPSLYNQTDRSNQSLLQAVTGKQVLFGFDAKRRPALYLLPSKQNTTEAEGQIQFTVWMLERSIDMMGIGVECVPLESFTSLSNHPFLKKNQNTCTPHQLW